MIKGRSTKRMLQRGVCHEVWAVLGRSKELEKLVRILSCSARSNHTESRVNLRSNKLEELLYRCNEAGRNQDYGIHT